ncbi:hypothetical protein PCANC_10749 [Puccinia coronata f. sp. avenae]|uniref:DUF1746 domain-containing protein n=1 Tax=Puccinia coronata f. sp. avenae TaxID=200324 RepID=A0A2N5VSU4_9BASI|nr:hypothetical protein PCANC_10749 [Puccinia coronata f. sp. avenae]
MRTSTGVTDHNRDAESISFTPDGHRISSTSAYVVVLGLSQRTNFDDARFARFSAGAVSADRGGRKAPKKKKGSNHQDKDIKNILTMDPPSLAHASHPGGTESMNNVSITNVTSMFVERDPSDSEQAQELARAERSEQRRKIKLAMLMQQLEFLFYALVVLCYTLDGKNLIFILRTVSEVQFSQPKQIQPDRPLRFFALASFAICFCALFSHLSLISSSNYNPSGILVDFVGQFTWKYPFAIVVFLLGLDVCSCLVQLLLVLISFTQSHSISISAHPTDTVHSQRTSIICPDPDDIEANQTSSKTSDLDAPLNGRDSEPELPHESSQPGCVSSRSGVVRQDSSDFQEEDSFLFDLTISQVKALLFSTDTPTSPSPSTAASSSATPTSTPRPSRAADSVHPTIPVVPTNNNRNSSTDNHHPPALQSRDSSTASSPTSSHSTFVVTTLPSRTVVIPIV